MLKSWHFLSARSSSNTQTSPDPITDVKARHLPQSRMQNNSAGLSSATSLTFNQFYVHMKTAMDNGFFDGSFGGHRPQFVHATALQRSADGDVCQKWFVRSGGRQCAGIARQKKIDLRPQKFGLGCSDRVSCADTLLLWLKIQGLHWIASEGRVGIGACWVWGSSFSSARDVAQPKIAEVAMPHSLPWMPA